mgnify:CR=1 FL=1
MALLCVKCKAEIIPVRTICLNIMAKDELSEDLPMDAPERKRLPFLLRRSWYLLNQAFRRSISYVGPTPYQFSLLRTFMILRPHV